MAKYVYLLETTEDFIKTETINDLVSKYKDYEVVKYDDLDSNEEPLEALNTLNFLVEHKLYIISHIFS